MSVDGTWKIVVKTPLGDEEAILEAKADGGRLTGTQSSRAGQLEIYDGAVDGDRVGWKVNTHVPFTMTLTFDGTLDGDTMSGHTKAGMFPRTTFTGQRA